MSTVAQENAKSLAQSMGRPDMININKDSRADAKSFSLHMRSANFKMGSILPESNSYKPSQLERSSSGAQIGINKSASYKPAIQKPINS